MTADHTALVLYSYWRSSAAYRVRIALNLKGLAYQQIPVHLVRDGGEQLSEQFRGINPQGLVPVLLHREVVLTQSLAICEFLEEHYPDYPLLPSDSVARARVRSLVLQIACEIHPINNLRVQKHLKSRFGKTYDASDWMSHWMGNGFEAIEQQLPQRPANEVIDISEPPGLFECFLVPQVYNAERFRVELGDYPKIMEIVTRCRNHPAFISAAPENQPDAVLA